MNPYLEEMREFKENILAHYGTKRHSGRYPWGSGEQPFQRSGDFLSRIEELKKQNFSYVDPKDGKTYTGETAIAKYMGMSTGMLRVQMSLAKDERRTLLVEQAKSLRDRGYSLNQIADEMGFNNDSSVRSLLNEKSETRMKQAKATAEFIRKQVDEKGMIDVGAGVERELGVPREKLQEALYILEMEGYPNYGGRMDQVTNPGRKTTIKVVCPPGTGHKEIFEPSEIHSLYEYSSRDGGQTFETFRYPKSMDINRLQIVYAEDGGTKRDGLIELRRGVEDISLGNSTYAQVRILVDNDRYLKGMAVYSDDLPDGVDVRFHTNKSKGTPYRDVMKPIKEDPDNPFGSLIKANGQRTYTDENGVEQLSLINKRAEEGDWDKWANKLPSQFLSKQPYALVKKQLGLSAQDKQDEFDEICALTNPTVKKKLLKDFSDDCDAAAVHLKAAALPRQRYQVILPLGSIKDNEVYAPNYDDGDTVALIRYPHGGTFEIPILTVNNKQREGQKIMGKNPRDAVGINSKVAERLSGADFDGDTVMVIPCNSDRSSVKLTSTRPLQGLVGFDPKLSYGTEARVEADGTTGYYRDGHKIKVMKNTQNEMGKISNLITDMTLLGSASKNNEEIARAVRHSMVVIDAAKHKLDYKQSEKDNGIAELKARYQGHIGKDGKYHEGAATLISRSKSETSVLKRQGSPTIDPETGKLVWKTADNLQYVDRKTGAVVTKMQKSTKMMETDDARTLVSKSNNPIENAYADYANKMKSLGNQARLEILATKDIPYDANAKRVYQNEVNSLDHQLNIAEKNAPRERMAQTMANSVFKAKKEANPDITKAEEKKLKQQALTQARVNVGAHRQEIKVSDREWDAIQAGAITPNRLNKILKYMNADDLRSRATPRDGRELSDAKVSKIQTMRSMGYSTAQIANAVGVSSSTVLKYFDRKE